MKIPTIIPKHLVRMGSWLRNGPWLLRIYRLVLVIIASILLVAALSSGYVLVATVAGIAAGIWLTDDVKKTWSDLWNLNFWVFRP